MSRAYFVGGPWDGEVKESVGRPPDHVKVEHPQPDLPFERSANEDYSKRETRESTLYSRNDLTGGITIYVPTGTLLHDAFERVLNAYATNVMTARRESRDG
jgi:hypothetical protein